MKGSVSPHAIPRAVRERTRRRKLWLLTCRKVFTTQLTPDTRARQDVLIELGDLVLRDPSDDVRGCGVVDSDDTEIGHVTALFIDNAQRKVCFLQVGTGGFLGISERQFLIPIENVTHTSETTVYINRSRDHVVNSPTFDPSLTTWGDRDD